MDTVAVLARLLRAKKRPDLAELVGDTYIEFDVSDQYGSYLFSHKTTAELYAPFETCERLRNLPQADLDLILAMLREVHPPRPHDIEIVALDFLVDPERPTLAGVADEALLSDIDAQRSLMIAVATDGPRIKDVHSEYIDRRKKIQRALEERGLNDPNPHTDLWSWYGKWSSGDLPTYRSRRQYITEMYEPLVSRVESGRAGGSERILEPTGWQRVDRGLSEMRERLQQAEREEHYQTVGLLCREILISTAQAVYDPARHLTIDGVLPSNTDAKRMLEAFYELELAGSGNKEARKHARASLDLANKLQHSRTATFRSAALCAETTTSVANMVAIVSGQRDPE